MTAILSIDFDYFINASSQERAVYFPEGCDNASLKEVQAMWEKRYEEYPALREVGVIPEYNVVLKKLRSLCLPKDHVVMANSHKVLKSVIDDMPRNTELSIVNIDFHHDFYHFFVGRERCNCGNWLRRVLEERPHTDVLWIRRSDSQIHSLDGVVPFAHTDQINVICDLAFDYVFMCRSPEWSPPHLFDRFEEMATALLEYCKA